MDYYGNDVEADIFRHENWKAISTECNLNF